MVKYSVQRLLTFGPELVLARVQLALPVKPGGDADRRTTVPPTETPNLIPR